MQAEGIICIPSSLSAIILFSSIPQEWACEKEWGLGMLVQLLRHANFLFHFCKTTQRKNLVCYISENVQCKNQGHFPFTQKFRVELAQLRILHCMENYLKQKNEQP